MTTHTQQGGEQEARPPVEDPARFLQGKDGPGWLLRQLLRFAPRSHTCSRSCPSLSPLNSPTEATIVFQEQCAPHLVPGATLATDSGVSGLIILSIILGAEPWLCYPVAASFYLLSSWPRPILWTSGSMSLPIPSYLQSLWGHVCP